MGGGMFPEPREAVSVRPLWPALPGRCRWRAAGGLKIKYRCGCEFFYIPDPGSKRFRIRIKTI
jgi:hypothetical protein